MPLIHRDELDSPTIRCQDDGAPISLIIDESEPGQGPRLHRHVYDETRVIQRGNISLQVGDQQLTPPQETLGIIPPGVPHKFVNDGPAGGAHYRAYLRPALDPKEHLVGDPGSTGCVPRWWS